TPFTLGRLGAGALRGGRRNTAALARQALMSGRAYTRSRFRGGDVDQLWTPWLLHAGLGPDHATGGAMLPVMAAGLHGAGLPVVRGGARRFVAAFESLLRDCGAEVHLSAPVDRVVLERGRAVGVASGDRMFRA